MADNLNLLRLNRFDGGITKYSRDRRLGYSLLIDNFDIWKDKDKITPEFAFKNDSVKLTLTSLTQSAGVATATISTGHNFLTGDSVVIAGATPSDYNGTKAITGVTSTTFTFAVDSGATSPATGTITVTGPAGGMGLITGYAQSHIEGVANENDTLFATAIRGSNRYFYKKQNASSSAPNPWEVAYSGIATTYRPSPLEWHEYDIEIEDITGNGTTVTVNTTENHGLVTGDYVVIHDTTVPDWNKTVQVTVSDSNTFTFSNSTSGSDSTSDSFVSVGYLYVVTETNVHRAGSAPAASSGQVGTQDRFGNAMVLPVGDVGDQQPVSFLKAFGSLFIGKGRYISEIDRFGTFIPNAWMAPIGWEIVSMKESGSYIAVLCQQTNARGATYSRVFYWDASVEDGYVDEVTISMGGPQVVFSLSNRMFVVCAEDGWLRVYPLSGGAAPVAEFYGVGENSYSDNLDGTYKVVPNQSVYVKDDTAYFSVQDIDGISHQFRFGMSAIGWALVRSHSITFSGNTDDTQPVAAIASGDNLYISSNVGDKDDNDHFFNGVIEVDNDPTFASASLTTPYLDSNQPEYSKEWTQIVAITTPMVSGWQLKIERAIDDSDDYTTIAELTSGDDQTADGETPNTFWKRAVENTVGRSISTRISLNNTGGDATTTNVSLIEFAWLFITNLIYG